MRTLGYSMVEILVVIGIAVILVAMSAGPILGAIRGAAVGQSAAQVVYAADEARLLARHASGIGTPTYGIRISDDPRIGRPQVSIMQQGADGVATELLDGRGQPMFRYIFPNSVLVCQGNGLLSDASREGGSPTSIIWWYQSGTGIVMEDPARPHLSVGVGLKRPVLNRPFGRDSNDLISSRPAPVLAAGSAAAPGLWLRSADNLHRAAISVYPCGIAQYRRLASSE